MCNISSNDTSLVPLRQQNIQHLLTEIALYQYLSVFVRATHAASGLQYLCQRFQVLGSTHKTGNESHRLPAPIALVERYTQLLLTRFQRIALFLPFDFKLKIGIRRVNDIQPVFPIIILFVPLSDTCLAIIRRKLKGQKISEADRSHLHHVLMYKIGLSHRNTVLLLYFVTFLFGVSAVITYFNEAIGVVILAILCICAWIFIELTGMINPRFHPLIGFLRRTIGHPRKSADAFFEANKLRHDDTSAK